MQKRASVSRRVDHRHGSLVRARSEERRLSAEAGEDTEQAKAVEEAAAMLKQNDTMEDYDSDDGILAGDDVAHKVREATEENKKEEEEDEFHDAVEDVPPGPERIHRRAMSDPFDTPLSDKEMEEIRKSEQAAVEKEEQNHLATNGHAPVVPKLPLYPTLPRYPVAATRDKNCWSEPPLSIYSVRGANYLKDKKKVPSKDYLLRARGLDVFLFDEPVDLDARSTQILNGQLRSLPTLSINFQFPWGCMILYFEIPGKLSKYVGESNGLLSLDDDLSVSERVLANWLQGDQEYRNERLKLIPYVAEGPWVVRNMVTGRPAIIGKKLPVSYNAIPADPAANLAPLLQCTLDIGSSSATAKRIVSVCRRYMSALTVDIGFVIQGETEDELPEQMLGASRIHGADPLKAPKL